MLNIPPRLLSELHTQARQLDERSQRNQILTQVADAGPNAASKPSDRKPHILQPCSNFPLPFFVLPTQGLPDIPRQLNRMGLDELD
jgi:hypothetical protein